MTAAIRTRSFYRKRVTRRKLRAGWPGPAGDRLMLNALALELRQVTDESAAMFLFVAEDGVGEVILHRLEFHSIDALQFPGDLVAFIFVQYLIIRLKAA